MLMQTSPMNPWLVRTDEKVILQMNASISFFFSFFTLQYCIGFTIHHSVLHVATLNLSTVHHSSCNWGNWHIIDMSCYAAAYSGTILSLISEKPDAVQINQYYVKPSKDIYRYLKLWNAWKCFLSSSYYLSVFIEYIFLALLKKHFSSIQLVPFIFFYEAKDCNNFFKSQFKMEKCPYF